MTTTMMTSKRLCNTSIVDVTNNDRHLITGKKSQMYLLNEKSLETFKKLSRDFSLMKFIT